jgi:hypothetical protein
MPSERYCISFEFYYLNSREPLILYYTRDRHGRTLDTFNRRKPLYHYDKQVLIEKMLYCLGRTRDDLPALKYKFIPELEMKIIIAEWKLKNA